MIGVKDRPGRRSVIDVSVEDARDLAGVLRALGHSGLYKAVALTVLRQRRSRNSPSASTTTVRISRA